MENDMMSRTRSKPWTCLLIFALLLFVSSVIDAGVAMAKTATMVITETTEDNFTSDVGIIFLAEKTVLLDPVGNVSDLRYIRLPCRAEVAYETSDAGKPVARKIMVLETLRRKQDKDPSLPE
ncbi:hypothetical protein [uncultured Desulfosarcina sp.]|uniref:hypothetical protein n=1 Tax=uncultured Desulfosarcina sp. TaxID=218289 RepID=UPI0029C98BC9|nr:hypothetical protein [uncultured Desulfosarcina sp.]